MKAKVRKFLVLTCIVIAVLVAIHTILVLITSARVRAAYAELKTAGRPMTTEEVVPPWIPGSTNAAPLYRAAFALIEAEADLASRNWSLVMGEAVGKVRKGESLSPDTEQALREFFSRKTVTMALEILRQAAARTMCNFNLDYSKGPGILMPHLAQMRSATRLVAWRACFEAGDKRSEEAWDLLMLGLAMSDALRDEPILISQLVRIAQLNLMFSSLEYALDVLPVDAERYGSMAERLQAAEDNGPMIRAMDAERIVMGGWCFDLVARKGGLQPIAAMCSDGDSGYFRYNASIFGIVGRPLVHLDHATYLKTMGMMTDALSRPYWQNKPEWGQEVLAKVPRYCFLTGLLVPALDGCVRKQAYSVAWVRLARTALALKLQKARLGVYPDALEKLEAPFLPEPPGDPFAGRSFFYRRQGDGFLLYSAGENRQDDGGRRKEDCADGEGWDIAWTSRQ